MDDLWQLFATQLHDRVSGPMKFRIVLQPIMATYFAIRSGLRDTKTGRDPYFWSFLIGRGHRFDLIKSGWQDVGRVVLLAGGLDLVYQFFVQSSIHLRAAVIVAFVLAVVPYVIVRGIVTRIANAMMTSRTVSDAASQRNPRAVATPIPNDVSLISDLLEKPASLSTASKYTVMNGIIYLGAGALLIVWPGAVQTLLMDPDFVGHEGALFRVIGMAVAVIGWLYLFGGRSGARQFGPASVLDRLVLVPAVLVPLVVAGVFPHTLGMFAILDPALGIGAWVLHNRRYQ